MPTLEQIQAKLKKLQGQAEALIAKRAQSVLNDIRKLMETHGLTTADIDAHSSTAKKRGRPAGSVSKPKTKQAAETKSGKAAASGKLPAKYRDPKSGATWSGWARPPLWIKDVKDRSNFLIDGRSDRGAVKASVVKPAGKKAAAKKVSRKNAAVKTVSTKALKAPAKKTTAKKATAKRPLAKRVLASKKSGTRMSKSIAATNQDSSERALTVSAVREMPAI